MKPSLDSLAICTATVDPLRAQPCLESWVRRAAMHLPTYVVWSTFPLAEGASVQDTKVYQRALLDGTTALLDTCAPDVHILGRHGGGVVPAFAWGVQEAFAHGAEAVICLHDDVEIEQEGWDQVVLDALATGVKFAGFGGATSLGSADLYHTPYDPMQLARGGFVSNMRDAEAHGRRSRQAVPCVCFDGFCQIGTKDWFGGAWQALVELGVQHHFYDGMLGCLAARAHAQPGMMLPVACHHLGGQTAVGSEAYQCWARTRNPEGDQGFWKAAHLVGYEEFKDVLPMRVEQFR